MITAKTEGSFPKQEQDTSDNKAGVRMNNHQPP